MLASRPWNAASDDFGVHASAVCIDKRVHCDRIGEFVHGDPYRAGGTTDQINDAGEARLGLLNQLIVLVGRECARREEVVTVVQTQPIRVSATSESAFRAVMGKSRIT